jgi:hypothetical protein
MAVTKEAYFARIGNFATRMKKGTAGVGEDVAMGN